MAMEKQKEYCDNRKIPFFAPTDGRCCNCGRLLLDTDNGHITGCPYCNRSYCD